MLLLTAAGCKSTPPVESPREEVPKAPEGGLKRLGRFFPNLVVIYDPGNRVNEFWVRQEIPLEGLGEGGTAEVLDLLKQGTAKSLDSLRKIVLPIMDKPYDPQKPDEMPRKAFKEMVRCAFMDNIAHANGSSVQPSCKDSL